MKQGILRAGRQWKQSATDPASEVRYGSAARAICNWPKHVRKAGMFKVIV
jgi:hypothetical protein